MKSTKDIYLAATFLALGAKYERTDKTDIKHQIFYFSMERPVEGLAAAITTAKDLDFIEQQYVNKALSVNIWDFKEALQRMKSIIHSV